jgi:uncharacterized protein (DUF58 family)
MQPTVRGILLFLLAAPLLAATAWIAALRPAAVVFLLLALALLALDWYMAGDVSGFTVTRRHDSRLSLGGQNAITLHLENDQGRPIDFWLRDEPPDAFEIDRDNGILSGQVAARGRWQGSYRVRPLRRGDYRFGDLNLRWRGPLGLVVRQGRIPAAGPVKVYPNLLDVRRYDLLLHRNRLQGLGLRQARRYGEGTEFERLREYLPDDEYRRIDWKATARRQRPVTIEYQTERSQNVIAVMDVGRMMQSPVAHMAKLDYVVNAVLLLAYVATGKGDKVGLMTFADDVLHFVQPRQGRGQFYRMLDMLYGIAAQPVEPNYRQALSYLALKQRKRSLVVIFTDLSGGVSMNQLISHVSMLARRTLPLVVTISDPDIHAAARERPSDSLTVYRRAAAAQLLDERRIALEQMARQGVLTLDVPANQLSIAVINRYLELKARTML